MSFGPRCGLTRTIFKSSPTPPRCWPPTKILKFATAGLRSLIVYWGDPALGRVLGVLLAWLVLFACEPAISNRWSGYFPIYLALQTVLVLALLFISGAALVL